MIDPHVRNHLVPVLNAIFDFNAEEKAKIANAIAHTWTIPSPGRTTPSPGSGSSHAKQDERLLGKYPPGP